LILKLVSTFLALAGIAWLALVFSSRAILVNEQVVQATLHERLECVYFTGTHTLHKSYWYSRSDTFVGRAACPRWDRVQAAPGP